MGHKEVPVTHLRKMMLEELQRLNYSAETIRSYIRGVEDFSRRFHCSPDRLGPRHIREYQVELFQKRKLTSGSVAVRLAALRFFYTKTLRRAWSVADTPYPKRDHRLPAILSQEEVARLILAAGNSFHRILLMTLYATGARNSELTHLKVSDIDSQRMVVHIRGGKGRRDRDVMLSAKLLAALRADWCYSAHSLPPGGGARQTLWELTLPACRRAEAAYLWGQARNLQSGRRFSTWVTRKPDSSDAAHSTPVLCTSDFEHFSLSKRAQIPREKVKVLQNQFQEKIRIPSRLSPELPSRLTRVETHGFSHENARIQFHLGYR